MFDVGKLPTDNLYKFLAFAGLILIGFSLVWPELERSHIELQLIDVKIGLDVQSRDMDELLAQALEFRNDNRLPDDPAKQKEIPQVKREIADVVRKTMELNALNQKQDVLTRRAIKWSNWLYYGVPCGLLMACSGFLLWYAKIQRYQDQILRDEWLRAKPDSVPAQRGLSKCPTGLLVEEAEDRKKQPDNVGHYTCPSSDGAESVLGTL